MSTRRQFIQSVPAVGTTFAVAGHLVLNESPAQAQEPTPLKGHFHPKGKAPSKFTLDVLKQQRPICHLPIREISRNSREASLAAMKYLVAWRLCEACLDVEAASIMLFE